MFSSTPIENKGYTILILLCTDKAHTGIDTPTKDIIVRMQAVGSNIAVGGIENEVLGTIVPTEIVVGFGEGGAVALADKRFIYGADGIAQSDGVPIQDMLCIETVCRGNRLLRLAYIAATRQQKASKEYVYCAKRHTYAPRVNLLTPLDVNFFEKKHIIAED